nr:hypothetical protein GCM10017745_54030 [Saccharothrix mutabilis subsp. capreolus]
MGGAVHALRPDPTTPPAAEHGSTAPNTAAPNTAAPNTPGPNTAGPNTPARNTAVPNSAEPTTTPPSTPPAGPSFPYRLYTHCGIDEAKIGDTGAVFTDAKGHEVRFRVRPEAIDFTRVCR